MLLFLPTWIVLPYNSQLGLRKSADDQSNIWTILLIKYVFWIHGMFIVRPADGPCLNFYTHNPQSENMGRSLLSQLLEKILDDLKYFGSYKLAHYMSIDQVLTTMAFHRCSEVEWGKTAVMNGLDPNEFCTAEVYGDEEEFVQARKRVRRVEGVSATASHPAVSVLFRAWVSCPKLASIRQNYNMYYGQSNNPCKAKHAGCNGGVAFDALPYEDRMLPKGVHEVDRTKGIFVVTSLMTSTVGHTVPISRNGYVKLLQALASAQ